MGKQAVSYEVAPERWRLFVNTDGHIGRPGSVRLAEKGGQARSLIARVALVPDHRPVVQPLSSKLVGVCVVNLAQRWALGRWRGEGEQTKTVV